MVVREELPEGFRKTSMRVWVDRSNVGEELGSWIMAGFAHERIECYMPMIAFKKFRVLNDSLDRAIYHCLSTGSEFPVTGDT